MKYQMNYDLKERLMKKWKVTMLMAVSVAAFVGTLHAQVVVKHIQTDKSPIAIGVWAGDTFYLSGQLASQVTPAGEARGTRVAQGDTGGLWAHQDTGRQRGREDPEGAPGTGPRHEGCREDDRVPRA